MKHIIILLILNFSISFGSSFSYDKSELQFLRTTYYSAVENEDAVVKLEHYIETKYSKEFNQYPPIIMAYSAGVKALNSKHAFWITTKYSYLVESMDLFEKAVAKDPDNIEIRFMRFSILHYVPSIVGYSSERASDLNIIYNQLLKKDYSLVPKDIQLGMVNFLIDSDRLSEIQLNEITKLSALLAKQ